MPSDNHASNAPQSLAWPLRLEITSTRPLLLRYPLLQFEPASSSHSLSLSHCQNHPLDVPTTISFSLEPRQCHLTITHSTISFTLNLLQLIPAKAALPLACLLSPTRCPIQALLIFTLADCISPCSHLDLFFHGYKRPF